MEFIDKMERKKRIRLSGPRSGPPDIQTSNCPGGAKDYGASRRSHPVLSMPDPEPWHIGYGVLHIVLSLSHEHSESIPTSITVRSQVPHRDSLYCKQTWVTLVGDESLGRGSIISRGSEGSEASPALSGIDILTRWDLRGWSRNVPGRLPTERWFYLLAPFAPGRGCPAEAGLLPLAPEPRHGGRHRVGTLRTLWINPGTFLNNYDPFPATVCLTGGKGLTQPEMALRI